MKHHQWKNSFVSLKSNLILITRNPFNSQNPSWKYIFVLDKSNPCPLPCFGNAHIDYDRWDSSRGCNVDEICWTFLKKCLILGEKRCISCLLKWGIMFDGGLIWGDKPQWNLGKLLYDNAGYLLERDCVCMVGVHKFPFSNLPPNHCLHIVAQFLFCGLKIYRLLHRFVVLAFMWFSKAKFGNFWS